MKLLSYIFLFVLVLIVSLIALMPLSFVVKSTTHESVVSYRHISGTIWKGEIFGLVVNGQDVGDIRIKNAPMEMLTGRLQYSFSFAGHLGSGKGVAELGLDRGVRVRDIIAEINVQNINNLDPRLRSMPSKVDVGVREGRWNNFGECQALSGNVRTDILTSIGRAYNWAGPSLSGVFSCDGPQTLVELQGSTGGDNISAHARLSGDGLYEVQAAVQTQDSGVASALESLEFQRTDIDLFEYVKSNAALTVTEDKA